MRTSADYDNAVAVTREIFWVGFADTLSGMHCNPYLLIDDHEAVLVDPGSIPDFPVVMRKVIDLVDPKSISTIIVQHQDPDVCGNLAVVEDVIERSDLRIVAHTNTLRLIRHLGLHSSFYAVEEHDNRLELKSGRRLEFLHTPYLHSPGAIVTYDPRTRSLFTSDIFGAVDQEWALFARGDYLHAMDSFHQAYMPSNQVLAHAMRRFEGLAIDRILPQHGSVLEGEQVPAAIAHLKQLRCGVDLMDAP